MIWYDCHCATPHTLDAISKSLPAVTNNKHSGLLSNHIDSPLSNVSECLLLTYFTALVRYIDVYIKFLITIVQ